MSGTTLAACTLSTVTTSATAATGTSVWVGKTAFWGAQYQSLPGTYQVSLTTATTAVSYNYPAVVGPTSLYTKASTTLQPYAIAPSPTIAGTDGIVVTYGENNYWDFM